MRSFSRSPSSASLAAAVLSLSLFSGVSAANNTYFAIVGAGVGPTGIPLPGQPARSHWSVGVATHLGLYAGDGKVQTDSAAPTSPTTIGGEFGSGSPYVFSGAGGKLVTWYGRTDHGADEPGTFELTILGVNPDGSLVVEAAFVAEFVVDPTASTGRYRGATGSWIMYAFTEPFTLGSSEPLSYYWYGCGNVTLKK